MQFDKFTLKSQEAIQSAQQLAESSGNQEITPAHLTKAILEQPDGVVVPALQKIVDHVGSKHNAIQIVNINLIGVGGPSTPS